MFDDPGLLVRQATCAETATPSDRRRGCALRVAGIGDGLIEEGQDVDELAGVLPEPRGVQGGDRGQLIVTGIRPAIAQTLVHLGVDLSGVNTRASLASGLRSAF